MSQTTTDPDVIERDLHATRSRLDNRLTELASRLSPGQIVDEGLDLLRTRQGIDFTRNLSEAVRERPIPVALVGVGLAWLMAGPRGHAPARSAAARLRPPVPRDDLATRAWNAGTDITRETGETDIAYRGRVTEARGKVLGLARSAQESAETYADRVQEALFAARQRVSEMAGNAADTASSMGSSVASRMSGMVGGAADAASSARSSVASGISGAGDTMQDMGDRMSGTVNDLRDQGRRLGSAAAGSLSRARDAAGGAGGSVIAAITDNPVLLGAVGLGIGALLGALIPPTEWERENLGGAARDARATIEGVVREATDRGTDLGRAAMDAGRQTARDVTRQASEFGSKATDAALDVAGQAREHASAIGTKANEAARDVAAKATDGPRPNA